jgi:hypothetical protein
MTLRIERSERQGFTVFALSGRLNTEYIGELQALFGLLEDYPNLILDLSELKLADRDGIRFLCKCEARGLRLENCPQYIRQWMKIETVNDLASEQRDVKNEDEQI